MSNKYSPFDKLIKDGKVFMKDNSPLDQTSILETTPHKRFDPKDSSRERLLPKSPENTFTLSDKIIKMEYEGKIFHEYIYSDDVKEFIKRVKASYRGLTGHHYMDGMIDKLAGKELV